MPCWYAELEAGALYLFYIYILKGVDLIWVKYIHFWVSEFQKYAWKNIGCQETLVVPISLASTCICITLQLYGHGMNWIGYSFKVFVFAGLLLIRIDFLLFLFVTFTCMAGVTRWRKKPLFSSTDRNPAVNKLWPKYSFLIYTKLCKEFSSNVFLRFWNHGSIAIDFNKIRLLMKTNGPGLLKGIPEVSLSRHGFFFLFIFSSQLAKF